MEFSDFVLRLLIIIAVAFCIGLERKLTGHHASFTTSILIAIGSFVFFAVEKYIGTEDTRIPANIITGIGFLCSGVIFKHGATVNGLNTAATLWSTAAISVLIGNGEVKEGLIAAALLVFLNVVMHYVAPKIRPVQSAVTVSDHTYEITVECLETDVKKVRKILTDHTPEKLSLDGLQMDTLTGTKCRITARVTAEKNPARIVASIVDRIYEKDVISVAFARVEE